MHRPRFHDALDVKAKLKGAETPEEILTLAKEEGYELTDGQLDGISGGWGKCNNDVYDCPDDLAINGGEGPKHY